jgi:Flp pilus assembly CpaE family ATPase
MREAARVVVAMESADVAEEVMQFLDRSGVANVVATAFDDRQLEAATRQSAPDVVVAQPGLAKQPGMSIGTWLAIDTRESVASLRAAVAGGAAGYFLWPGEREALLRAVTASVARTGPDRGRARIVGVHAARGGAGTTFVATHLAAALARRGVDCVLLDLDPLHADVAAALGVPDQDVHTLGELIPLAEELDLEQLREALWRHPEGFTTLPPPPPQEAAAVPAGALRLLVHTAATGCDVLVLHLPRNLGELDGTLQEVTRIIEVVNLDVLAFRATSRALEAVDPLGPSERISFVVNRARPAEVTPADVERVFGVPPLAVIPSDRAVGRAQDHGQLIPARSRIGRVFTRLAAAVLASTDPDVVVLTGDPSG